MTFKSASIYKIPFIYFLGDSILYTGFIRYSKFVFDRKNDLQILIDHISSLLFSYDQVIYY